MNTNIIQLDEVIREMAQGFSKPFLCRSENGDEYIVKGLGSTRRSQISEWICGNLAKILGLPIADFSFVEISSELWEELPDHFRNLGSGIAFGSKKVAGVNWLERFNAQDISEDLQRKLIAFDLWIKNMDRTLNNPNLLYQAQNKTLVIIDHNQAFDPQFNLDDFLETHIFREVFAHYNDLINRIEVESVFSNALAHLDDGYFTRFTNFLTQFIAVHSR